MYKWRWPILSILIQGVSRMWKFFLDDDAWSKGWIFSFWWALPLGIFGTIFSSIFWHVPGTQTIQIYGTSARPGFWIYVAALIPAAFMTLWTLAGLTFVFLTWVPHFLKLFVPVREYVGPGSDERKLVKERLKQAEKASDEMEKLLD